MPAARTIPVCYACGIPCDHAEVTAWTSPITGESRRGTPCWACPNGHVCIDLYEQYAKPPEPTVIHATSPAYRAR